AVGATGLVSVATLTMTCGSITTSSVGGIQLNGNVAASSSASTGSAVIAGGFVQMGAATRTFTVADGPAGVDLDISAEIKQQGGTVGFIKAGAGTLRLEGATSNTYTGPTTVNAGTLELDKTAGVAVPLAGLAINGGVVREV